jgi:hypothetical protein
MRALILSGFTLIPLVENRPLLPHETNRNQKPLLETVETRQFDFIGSDVS